MEATQKELAKQEKELDDKTLAYITLTHRHQELTNQYESVVKDKDRVEEEKNRIREELDSARHERNELERINSDKYVNLVRI